MTDEKEYPVLKFGVPTPANAVKGLVRLFGEHPELLCEPRPVEEVQMDPKAALRVNPEKIVLKFRPVVRDDGLYSKIISEYGEAGRKTYEAIAQEQACFGFRAIVEKDNQGNITKLHQCTSIDLVNKPN